MNKLHDHNPSRANPLAAGTRPGTARWLLHRLRRYLDKALDLAMRVIPVSALVAIGAFVAAQQVVSPQRRTVKLSVLLALLVLMFRLEMCAFRRGILGD